MQQPTPDDLASLAGCLRSGAPLAEHERALAAVVLEDAAERCRPALAARLRRKRWAARNSSIYQLGLQQQHFREGSLRARACALIAAAKLYRDGQWVHHRALAAPPASIIGTVNEVLWRAFKTGPFPRQRMVEGLIR